MIDLRERNILVSAAAGSGKTAVLVERIIQKITDEKKPIDIDRLLVVTFTKAAAAEMRDRISTALTVRLQEEPDNENLQHQLSLLHNAQITTIDSFCQYIIRNYFHVIDLEPMFQVGDETDLQLMQEEVLAELLEEKYRIAREENDRDFLDMMQIFATGRTDKEVEQLVLKLYSLAQSYPFPEKQLKKWGEMYAVSDVRELGQEEWMQRYLTHIKQSIKDYAAMAGRAVELCQEPGAPEMYLSTIQSESMQIERLLAAESLEQLYEEINRISFGRLKAARGGNIDAELREEIKALRGAYKDKGIQKLQKELFYQSPEEMAEDIKRMSVPVRELVQLTREFAERYTAKKREESIIDFNDMEHFALQILVDEDDEGNAVPSMVARELQEHFEEILTDEYQDSNYVQEMILTSMSRGPEKEPYLFMVGDVKQSIYQFRLARPDLFMEKFHRYTVEEGGKNQRIDLRKNFRSRESVLESANYIFEKIMRAEFGGIAYDEAARLVTGAKFAECDKRTADQTEIIVIEQDAENAFASGKRSSEAIAIGEKIRELVQGDDPLYIMDQEEYRPLQYRDIVILLRSIKGWSEDFQETLAEMGIPAYAPKKTGYFSTREVETMLNLLRVIDNPRQDIPLVAVLRSCLVGLTDEELAEIGALPSQLNFWDRVCELGREHPQELQELSEKLSGFLDRVEEYQERAASASVYELLRQIYEETGYYSIMSAMPGGEQRSANLDILLQQALEFAEHGHRGIFGFCRYIETLKKSDIDFGEASLSGEGADAVQLVSIHKSKGLEFPVVFVAGMGKQFNLQDARRTNLLDMDYGLGVNYVDLEERFSRPTLMKRFIASHIIENALTEEIRILYVALTRAKEKLILTGVVKDLDKKLPDWQQKGMRLGRQELLVAKTYFDWVMPVIAKRPAFAHCQKALLDGEREAVRQTAIDSEELDSLFRMRLVCPQSELEEEKEELKRILLRREELKNWDTEIEYDRGTAEAMQRQREYRYPFEAEGQLPVKVSVSELKRRALEQQTIALQEEDAFSEERLFEKEREEIPQPSFRREEEKISVAYRGTLYHLVMEHLPYEDIGEGYDFNQLLTKMERQGFLTEKERAEIWTGTLQKFVRSSLGKRMKQAAIAGKLLREKQFMVGIAASKLYPELNNRETVLVQGIIDACFEEGGEWILVDYKTDWVEKGEEEKLRDKYREQLCRYAEALEQLTGKRVREKIIYALSLGKEVAVP